MTLALPKTRPSMASGSNTGAQGHRAASVHGLAHRQRNISKGNRQNSSRITLRGELFDRVDLEDAIHFEDNKHTILLNFEEWIKLATDNKITLKNSWLIALIDYFKDLNVIKDGENINFQRALATLDGCVKIYLSRVELVASETGKLLSGLATKAPGNDAGNGGDGDEDDDVDAEGEDDQNGGSGSSGSLNDKKRRKMNRVVELTLVDFEVIRVKKLDQELAIDPLFKKALSEFDEGGAKSLLLNTLSIDRGRVVFATAAAASEEAKNLLNSSNQTMKGPTVNLTHLLLPRDRILLLGSHLQGCEEASLCPLLGELKLVLQDINQAKKVLGEVNTRFMDDGGENLVEPLPYSLPDFDDYDDGGELLNHMSESVVRLMIMENNNDLHNRDSNEAELEPTSNMLDRDLMAYFDRNMRTNWRGPEHWKVQRFKEAHRDDFGANVGEGGSGTTSNGLDGNVNGANGDRKTSGGTDLSKKKEKVSINFYDEIDTEELEEMVFAAPKNVHQIMLKVDANKSESKHKLPEDIQFSSSRLTRLFLKDRLIVQWQRIGKVSSSETGSIHSNNDGNNALTDENYFANQYQRKEEEIMGNAEDQDGQENPFFDDGNDYGGIDFNDALGDGKEDKKMESTPEPLLSQGGVRKARPEYVNFSRIAKRVDVRLLKDNIWKSIKEDPEEEKKEFTEVLSSIGKMYVPEERKDLSTSFCFICLLHLANEHSLTIEGNEEHDDFTISGFKQEVE